MDVLKQIQVREDIQMELISCIKNFPKHCKTACQNIWRNGVMSMSSIFAVSITLLLIGIIGLVAVNVEEMTYSIENSLTIYAQVERNLNDKQAQQIKPQIEKVDGVKKVTFSTKSQELDKLIEIQDKDGKKLFEGYRKDNPLGSAFIIEVQDTKKIQDVAEKIEIIDNIHSVNTGGANTYSLVNTLETVRNAGSVFVVALTIIALFMISNTIKLTITARQTEISIMRMVGASNWFIRLPYMLEGLFIGLLGAIIPVLIIYFGYSALYTETIGSFSALLSLKEPLPFLINYSGILVALGCGVGLVGSFVSVRKFLKF